jgi:hypothetical protein
MNQLSMLDEHFSRGGSLTVGEALTQFGVYALSQRVGELKRELGKPVVDDWVALPSGKRVKRYRYA